jgi:2,4-dienoyl-CoA reductase-like NADH-dependent reductase (Old Yellow Enzyme family)
MPTLVEPFTLKRVTLRNGVVTAPMCQYQARDGFLNEWRQPHYAMPARGGAGLLAVEATRRKAGCAPPWQGGTPLKKGDPRTRQPMAPSALPFMASQRHMPLEDIRRTQQELVHAARRVRRHLDQPVLTRDRTCDTRSTPLAKTSTTDGREACVLFLGGVVNE